MVGCNVSWLNYVNTTTFPVVLLVLYGTYFLCKLVLRNSLTPKLPAGRVGAIVLYPVKSMRGQSVNQAECTYSGLIHDHIKDRHFMVTDSEYKFVSSRELPILASITVVIKEDGKVLCLKSKSGKQIEVHISSCKETVCAEVWLEPISAIDCGDKVRWWLEKLTGQTGLRLVYHSSNLKKRNVVEGPSKWNQNAKVQDTVAFQDGFPYMLMCRSSVRDMNENHGIGNSIPIENFRANIVVDNEKPYSEDTWDKVCIGDAVFTNIKPCERCIMTTVNPDTGIRSADNQPLKALRKYRCVEPDCASSPIMGINLVLDKPGKITVGDHVYVTYK